MISMHMNMKNILNMVFRALSMMVVCTTAAAQTGRQAILEGVNLQLKE